RRENPRNGTELPGLTPGRHGHRAAFRDRPQGLCLLRGPDAISVRGSRLERARVDEATARRAPGKSHSASGTSFRSRRPWPRASAVPHPYRTTPTFGSCLNTIPLGVWAHWFSKAWLYTAPAGTGGCSPLWGSNFLSNCDACRTRRKRRKTAGVCAEKPLRNGRSPTGHPSSRDQHGPGKAPAPRIGATKGSRGHRSQRPHGTGEVPRRGNAEDVLFCRSWVRVAVRSGEPARVVPPVRGGRAHRSCLVVRSPTNGPAEEATLARPRPRPHRRRVSRTIRGRRHAGSALRRATRPYATGSGHRARFAAAPTGPAFG